MYLSTVQYFQQRGIVRVTNGSNTPGSTGLMMFAAAKRVIDKCPELVASLTPP